MSCGCAERMRTHVLPLLGFVREEGTAVWVHDGFVEPQLRRIADEDIERYHFVLMCRLAYVVTKERLRELYRLVHGKELGDDRYERMRHYVRVPHRLA